MEWVLRLARLEDIPALEELIPLSARSLQTPHYSPAQIQAALGPVFGVDRQLIHDETYFVAEGGGRVVGCGGWSKRKSLYGGGEARKMEDCGELDPALDPARIRAFFVHPEWARQGIGRGILAGCEQAMKNAGFQTAELVATLAGEPLYASCAYKTAERFAIPLPGGLSLPVVRMNKTLKNVA